MAIACSWVAAPAAFGQADFIALLEKLELKALKSIQITCEAGNYSGEVVVHISNAADRNILLKNASFDVVIEGEKDEKDDEGQPTGKKIKKTITLGSGGRAKVELTKAKGEAPVITKTDLAVALGDKEQALGTLVDLVNLVGDPEWDVTIRVAGDAQLWVETKNGYVLVRDVKVDLGFKPEYKREVLFK